VALESPSRRDTNFVTPGEKALAISGSQAVSVAQNAMTSAAFSMIKDQVSSFVESSKVLMKVLDEVGKAHPFIQSMSGPLSPMGQGDRTDIYYILQL
jgi:hypothetical protein